MPGRRHLRRRYFWYIIPVLIGMGGLVFSVQFENPILRFALILLSVCIPVFASGNFLARHGTRGMGRVVLLAGFVLLMLGIAATFRGFPEMALTKDLFSGNLTEEISQRLGIFSLLLGLIVVMLSVMRTGEAIEEIGEQFRHLADQISEGFVLSSPDGTIILVNQRFLEMLDLDEDLVVGQNANQLVERYSVDAMEPHLDLRAKGLASEYEMKRNVRGEERQFWVSGTPIFNARGGRMGTLATVRDVTERNRMARRLEQYAKGLQELVEEQTRKLRQSEEQFRELLLQMNEGFLTIDSSYRIRFVNNRVCELLQIDGSAAYGREVFDFIDPPGRVKLMELLRSENAKLVTESRSEFNFIRTDGTLVPSVVAVAPVHDMGGQDTRYSLVVTDVSVLKRMQRQLELRANELEAANEELRRLDRAKDAFLSNVSHELKTPLSTINGYVEMLQSGSLGELQAPQMSALKVMERNLKRLVSLINEMIEFSRMEIRGIHLHMTLFDASRLLREAVASMQPHALAKDISMTIYCPENFPPIWADRGKLGQVLGILLSNAIKFSHEGGLIQVRVEERPDHTAALIVSDTGIGIDPAYHQRVFDKFFQVDSSMTRRYEGTGIGLSIAKSIVEAHGGHVELVSEASKGSTFTLLFPSAVFDTRVPQTVERGDLENAHILITAEETVFRGVLTDILSKCGCMTEDAHNGFECLRVAEETEPDLIVFDDTLLVSSGSNVLENLRDSMVTNETPVLVLTSTESGKPLRAISTISNTRFLPKPFAAAAFIESVLEALSGEPAAVAPSVLLDSDHEPKVLVIDQDPDLLEWISTALQRKQISCYIASDTRQAVEIAEQVVPDVILVDMDAPLRPPEQTLAELSNAPVTRGVPICVVGGRAIGAVGGREGVAAVLKKPFTIAQVIQIVQHFHRSVAHVTAEAERNA